MKHNKEIQALMNEILITTNTIQNKFPVLYMYLSETPLELSTNKTKVTSYDLLQYLLTLKIQLKTLESVKGVLQ